MSTIVATGIELITLRWLNKHKVNYMFQTSLAGGFYELGGAVVDFFLPDRMMAWRVMGEYWHKGVVKEGRDQMQKEILMALPDIDTVVDIWGADLETRPDETLRLALEGQEILH
jgi:hypothetical protein